MSDNISALNETEEWEIDVGTIKIKLSEPIKNVKENKSKEKEMNAQQSQRKYMPPPPSDSIAGSIFQPPLLHPAASFVVPLPTPQVPVVEDGETISSTLTDAIADPRERMNCLKIEDLMLRFAQSPNTLIEVPPQKNSFHKLLVFKLANRFRFEHAGYSDNYINGENGIYFTKTTSSIIPARLLISLEDAYGASNEMSYSNVPEQYVNGGGVGVVSTKPPPKVMKRNNAKSDASKQDNGAIGRKIASNEDLEKQYAEVRARIFGQSEGESPANASTSSSNNLDKTDSSKESNSFADEFQNLDISSSDKSNNSNMGRTIMANKSNTTTTNAANNNTKPQTSGGGQGNIKSSNKSTMRNNGDRFDPDFSRQRNPVPANYGMHAHAPIAGIPPYGMYPGQYFPPYHMVPPHMMDPNAMHYPPLHYPSHDPYMQPYMQQQVPPPHMSQQLLPSQYYPPEAAGYPLRPRPYYNQNQNAQYKEGR